MDGENEEYLSIKYRLYLKECESDTSESDESSEDHKRKKKVKSRRCHAQKPDKDSSQSKQASQKSKSSSKPTVTLSSTIPNASFPPDSTYISSLSEPSRIDPHKETDPCDNCVEILKQAAEFLTKIELEYGLLLQHSEPTPTSKFTHAHINRTKKRTSENVSHRSQRHEASDKLTSDWSSLYSNVSLTPASSFAELVKHRKESDSKRKSFRPTTTDELSTFSSASETNTITPISWMDSSESQISEGCKTYLSTDELKSETNRKPKRSGEDNVKNKLVVSEDTKQQKSLKIEHEKNAPSKSASEIAVEMKKEFEPLQNDKRNMAKTSDPKDPITITNGKKEEIKTARNK
ncbi:unnamed protein product [Thelazia callipaeda]|uniref:DUF4614 domain-containing protein n=1 Tax=Thelazia callipaeda TaxID=103827 RepID=A0A158RAK8_THECL|nr:unnamed protein product [Thelazia callipaeda]